VFDVLDSAAVEAGAAYGVLQASPELRRVLKPLGWRDVAPAGPDPRFPRVAFEATALSPKPAWSL
jgi:hypothetical protein